MTSLWTNFGDDPTDSLRDDIAAERRRLSSLERAEVEGRVAVREEWLRSIEVSRIYLAHLEGRLKDMLAAEESAAELAEQPREADAA